MNFNRVNPIFLSVRIGSCDCGQVRRDKLAVYGTADEQRQLIALRAGQSMTVVATLNSEAIVITRSNNTIDTM